MKFITLDAVKRNGKGKGVARRMRAAGRVPAVVYGKATESKTISVDPAALTKALAGPLRVNTPLDITITDTITKKTEDTLVIVKDHQYDPVTRELLHVDFMAITESTPVRVDVPLEKTGRSVGEQLGGILRMVHRTVPVVCLPKDIPAVITINATPLNAGITFHVKELELSEGITVALPPQEALLTISAVAVEETPAEDAAAKAGKKKKK